MPARLALPAKQRPATTPIVGTRPDRRAKLTKVRVSPRVEAIMSWGRAPPPSSQLTIGQRCASARA